MYDMYLRGKHPSNYTKFCLCKPIRFTQDEEHPSRSPPQFNKYKLHCFPRKVGQCKTQL